MNEADVLNYVRSTATLLGIPVDDERARRVASHLQRTVAMAAMLDAANLPANAELAEIYCPAPFQTNEYRGIQL